MRTSVRLLHCPTWITSWIGGKTGSDAPLEGSLWAFQRHGGAGFTVPYLSSEVYMVIPITSAHQSMWAFTKPFSLGLWLATISACIFVGLAVGFLEWRVTNTEYAGSLYQQLIMVVWFPISTLVLQERRIANKWSKVVLVVWLLMALTMMQCFLSNLYSILSADQQSLKLPKDCQHVGYWKGSIMILLLLSQFQFPVDKLKPFSTIDGYRRALLLGSENGGVDAIIDELPRIKLFNAKYGSRYTTVGPIKQTTGPGFELFSKCSHRHLGYPSQASQSLDVYGFTGLFIIMGTVVIAAILCSEYFLWQGRNRGLSSTGTTTITEQTTFQMINVAEETPTSTSAPNDGNTSNVEAAESEIDVGDNGNENSESGSDEA